jgi:hypothetical protein
VAVYASTVPGACSCPTGLSGNGPYMSINCHTFWCETPYWSLSRQCTLVPVLFALLEFIQAVHFGAGFANVQFALPWVGKQSHSGECRITVALTGPLCLKTALASHMMTGIIGPITDMLFLQMSDVLFSQALSLNWRWFAKSWLHPALLFLQIAEGTCHIVFRQ